MANVENKLVLITGSKGPSIFKASSKGRGSFICGKLTNIFVATDSNVRVYLRVRAIVPKKIKIPKLAPGRPYPISIKTGDCNDNLVVVAQQVLIPNENGLAIQIPTPDFVRAAKFINRFLEDTALSLTIIDDDDAAVTPQQVLVLDYAPIRTFYSPTRWSDYASILTDDINDQTYYYLGSYQGISIAERIRGLPPPPSGRIPFYIVSFTAVVRLTTSLSNPPAVTARTQFLIMWGGSFWSTLRQINPTTGTDGGPAILPPESQAPVSIPYNTDFTISGSLALSRYQPDFNITIYFNIPGDVLDDGLFSYTVTFGTIRVEVH